MKKGDPSWRHSVLMALVFSLTGFQAHAFIYFDYYQLSYRHLYSTAKCRRSLLVSFAIGIGR
ncbi:hypothetical protein HALO59_150276 [Halomonas sp. 59]|nr:hypothetical protein HALO59_150276 [Halomonas sp. 59]CAD5258983.1 hypothetical protein HALO113_160279 [Halomonas sp. 113]CAD5272889.1 hypothetical protein HALOI3_200279 [Halomonas sp. I3]VXB32120.1 hypothetical protein HALO98_160275 [Halomonas titanicae]VXC35755.1 hypothetical protein HALO153_320278 [Halomonas titanicae]